MISKNKVKFLAGLQQKKQREETKLYVAEGRKLMKEILLTRKNIHSVYALQAWFDENEHLLPKDVERDVVTEDEMKKISSMMSPQDVLCVVSQEDVALDDDDLSGALTLALDSIQDPGNMGTILRLAAWFGISTVLCSRGTVDIYNPKVVQATMGALCWVKVHYVDLPSTLQRLREEKKLPVYGTFLDGDDVYASSLEKRGVVVVGNEGNGISVNVEREVTHRLLIPSFSQSGSVESLNVSVATAIICSELRRRA